MDANGKGDSPGDRFGRSGFRARSTPTGWPIATTYLQFPDFQIATDFSREDILNLVVARHGASAVSRGIVPPRMAAPLAQQDATLRQEMTNQRPSLHRTKGSST